VLRPFGGAGAMIHAVPVSGHAHHLPDAIAAEARKLGLSAFASGSIDEALVSIAGLSDPSAPPAVLIMGSLYLAGEVLRANGQLPG
jgi:dihydrofolate synthase/folylpolyglutamate synthase